MYEKRKKKNRLYAVIPAIVAILNIATSLLDPLPAYKQKVASVITVFFILWAVGLALGIIPAPFPKNARIRELEKYFRNEKG